MTDLAYRQPARPTIAQFLAMPETQLGLPEVLSGAKHLDRTIRWVHISEITDLTGLLEGGELLLITGIGLPADAEQIRQYVSSIAELGVVGIVLEIGRRFDHAPTSLVRACEAHELPLVVLRRRVPFVRITEAMHSRISYAQLAELKFRDQVHRTFTEMSLAEATMYKIVQAVAALAGDPVVFENLLHRVLAYEPLTMPTEDLLTDWEARSRRVRRVEMTQLAGPELWLVTPVLVRGQMIGRLILLSSDTPTQTQSIVIERGAAALMLRMSYQRTSEEAEDDAETSAIYDLITRRHCGERQMSARLTALGVPIRARRLVGVVIEARTGDGGGPSSWETPESQIFEKLRELASRVACRILSSTAPGHRIAVLVSASTGESVEEFTRGIGSALSDLESDRRIIVSVGSPAATVAEIMQSFAEAIEVVRSISSGTPALPVYNLRSIELRGLFGLLREEPRLHAFVERSIGPLLEFDLRHQTEYFRSLTAFLLSGRSKSSAAKALCVSRQTVYERLGTVERVLDVRLDSDEVCTSLHAAIIARETLGQGLAL